MTHAQLSQHIGRAGDWILADRPLNIRVTVEDARESYGRLQYLIQPVAGRGQTWIDASRVRLDQETGQ